jgi:hypothetical protein
LGSLGNIRKTLPSGQYDPEQRNEEQSKRNINKLHYITLKDLVLRWTKLALVCGEVGIDSSFKKKKKYLV